MDLWESTYFSTRHLSDSLEEGIDYLKLSVSSFISICGLMRS